MSEKEEFKQLRNRERKQRIKKIKYLFVCLLGKHRVTYLRKNNIFGYLGTNVLFQPIKLPNGSQRIKIHNNVKIAADVTFYEHDVINSVFSEMDNVPYGCHHTCIEIFDNVFIGGHSIIIGNVSIGPNAIVGGGSVVTRDVLPGTVVAGNPAKVIGSFDDLHNKRKIESYNKETPKDNDLWQVFYDKNKL